MPVRLKPPKRQSGSDLQHAGPAWTFIACACRELLLLAGLLAFASSRPNLFPISHSASGTNDPKRACDSGDESSKLLRSAAGRERVGPRDFFSRPEDIARTLVLGLVAAEAKRHSG